MKQMKLMLVLMVVTLGLAGSAQGYWVDNFDGTAVNTAVWTECVDLFNDGTTYDWHPVTSPGDWTVSGGSLVKDTGYPSHLTAHFTPVSFASDPVLVFNARIKSVSSHAMEIGIGQAGGNILTEYLNANQPWGTGYLMLPFYAFGVAGKARPTDDWFDVSIEINKTTSTISTTVNGELVCSAPGEGSWLAGLSQIDTVTLTATGVDPTWPWYVDYVEVVPEPATLLLLAGGFGALLRNRKR